jgi:hypothetical protein
MLQERLQFRLVLLVDADEEQNTAAAARVPV